MAIKQFSNATEDLRTGAAGSIGASGADDGVAHGEVESAQAWLRLAVTLALSTIGGVGMWSVVVALPTVQAEFGVARGAASLPYTLTMIGFGCRASRSGGCRIATASCSPWRSGRSPSRPAMPWPPRRRASGTTRWHRAC